MIKLLFRLFRKQFLKLAFNEQSKPVDFDKLNQVFIDSDGRKYYMYDDDMEIPVTRRGESVKYLQELEACLSREELGMFTDGMIVALEREEKGRFKPDFAMIGFLIKEIQLRKEGLFHPEIMFNLISTLYIREDENPSVIDPQIHKQKVEQFKLDSQGGLYDFFYSAAFKAYLPFTEMSPEEFVTYWREGKAIVEAMKQTLSTLSKQESSKEKTTKEPL